MLTAIAKAARSSRGYDVRWLLALCLAGVAFGGLRAQPPAIDDLPAEAFSLPLDEPLPVSSRVVVGKFDNGLSYYIRENTEPANRAELRLVVNAGSVLEDDDQVGLAHFLEHMAFNGTRNFEKQELISFMESIGMRLGPGVNAYTSFDETVFQLQLPTDNPDYMATAFQILEDWANGLTLDSEEIDLERGVVIEEWRLGQGAQARIRDQQFPVILRDSKYARRLPIGTLENLQTFDHDALRRFYREWYRPELMAVVAVGDFDVDEIERLTREHFQSIPASESARPRPRYDVPDHEETLFSIATDPELPLTQVSVFHKMPAIEDWTVGGYRQRIVERLYNAMLGARFEEISRQPDPPFLAAASNSTNLVRPVSAYVLGAIVQETGIERGLETLLVESERVARFGFTAAELERQKADLLRFMEQQYLNRENRNSGSFAAEFARAYLTAESIPGIEMEYALYRRFIPEITLAEVDRVGEDWISDANRVVAVTAPRKPDLPVPSREELEAALLGAADAEITPYEETAPEGPLLAERPQGSEVVATRMREGGLIEWDLANGVTVVLKPTDFEEDQIVFYGYSPGGTSLASDEDFVPANTAVGIIANGGVGTFTAIDLQRELTGKLVNVAPFINDYEEGLRGTASPADLETLLQLIYLRMTAPRADETFYDIFQAQTRALLQNRSADPGAVFGDAFTRLIYQNHPRRQPPTVDMLEETDLARSLAVYEDRFGDAGDFTFIFVGNIDLEQMQPLVETYLGGLPVSGRTETWRDVGIRNPTGVIEEVVRQGIEPQSRTRIAFTGPFDYESQAKRVVMSAMAQLVETRLRDAMREELGGTYGVQVSPQLTWQPTEAYSLTIAFGSDPERADEMTETLFSVIETLKSEGPTAAELSDVQQALLRAYETGMEENRFWLQQLSASYRAGLDGAQPLLDYPDAVEALTTEDIRTAVEQYFDTENYVKVTLLPEE